MPDDRFKHRFLDLTKVEFWACQEAENDFYVPFDHLICPCIDLKKVAFFVGQEEKNDFKVTFDNLNHRIFNFIKSHFGLFKRQKMIRSAVQPPEKSLFRFTEVAFWAGPEAENKLKVSCEPLNIASSISTKSQFGMFKKSIMIQSDMRAFETSLSRIHTSRILG